MRILVDVDGVVADLHSAWLNRYNKDYNDNLKPEQITRWAIHEFVKPECGRKIYEYLNDPTLYDEVQEIPSAKTYIERLRAHGHDVVFLSSGFFPSKVKWLADKGFAIDFPYHDGRWETLGDVVLTGNKGLIKGDLMIDDYQENFLGFDGFCLLFDSPWNKDSIECDDRVYDWADIYNMIGFVSEVYDL